jgi:hypothetical protein
LPLEPLDVLALAIELHLIAIDLLLLAVIGYLVALQLITDQCAGAQTERTTDGSARARVTDRGADDATCRRAAKRTYASAFFTGTERAARASRE